MAFIDKIVKFHTFSKSTVRDNLTLGEAVNPSGHTVVSSQVRTDDIPAFIDTFQDTKEAALTWAAANVDANARHNDILYYGGKFNMGFSNPKCLIRVAKQQVDGKLVDLPAEQHAWADFTITDKSFLANADGKNVIAIHTDADICYVHGDNNAAVNSNQNSAFVRKNDGTFLDHFVAPTDQILGGQPSLGYGLCLFKSGTTKALTEGEETGKNNYIGNTFAGLIHFMDTRSEAADTSDNFKAAGFYVNCFEYIGDKLDATLNNIDDKISQVVGDAFEGAVASVTATEATQNLGLTVSDGANRVITVTPGSISESKLVTGSTVKTYIDNTALAEGGAISDAISDAISAATLADGEKIADTSDTSKLVTVEDVKTYVSENAKVTLTADTDADKTGITISPNDTESTAFTIGIDQTKIATKKSVDDLSSLVSGLPATIQAAQDAADDAMEEAQGKVASVTLGTVPDGVTISTGTTPQLSIVTAQNGVASDVGKLVTKRIAEAIASGYATSAANTAVDTIDGRSLASSASSTQGSYVSVTTAGSVGSGLTVNVNDSKLASTVSAASTAIQTVKVNSTALTATNNAVDITAIVGVDTTSQNGIILHKTSDNKVKVDVTPATYDADEKKFTQESITEGYFTTAGDVTTAISDAVDAITIPVVTTSENAIKVGVTASSHEVSVATADYTASTDTWTNKPYLVTGATVEAFVNDVVSEVSSDLTALENKVNAYHEAGVSYKIHDSQTLPDLAVVENVETYKNVILLVPSTAPGDQTDDATAAITGGYVEWLCVNKGTKEAPSWDWEQIGTTEADLHGYVSVIDSSQATTLANQGSVYASISSTGYLTLGVASATDSVMGVSKMFSGNYWELPSNVTDTAVSTLTASAMFTNIGARINRVTELANEKVSSVVADRYLTLAGLDVSTSGTSVTIYSVQPSVAGTEKGAIKRVECNMLYHNNYSNSFDTNTIVDGTSMFSNCTNLTTFCSDLSSMTDGTSMFQGCTSLDTFIGDLSAMTDGTSMFQGCTSLTTFISDLSSLTDGEDMFTGCTLDDESIECILDTIPVSDGAYMTLGCNAEGFAKAIEITGAEVSPDATSFEPIFKEWRLTFNKNV